MKQKPKYAAYYATYIVFTIIVLYNLFLRNNHNSLYIYKKLCYYISEIKYAFSEAYSSLKTVHSVNAGDSRNSQI